MRNAPCWSCGNRLDGGGELCTLCDGSNSRAKLPKRERDAPAQEEKSRQRRGSIGGLLGGCATWGAYARICVPNLQDWRLERDQANARPCSKGKGSRSVDLRKFARAASSSDPISSEFRPQFTDRAVCKTQGIALASLLKNFQMGGEPLAQQVRSVMRKVWIALNERP